MRTKPGFGWMRTRTPKSGATSGPISVIAAGGLATSASAFTVNSPLPNSPALKIGLVGNELVISWPSDAIGYALQQNADLNPANWMDYTGQGNTDGATKTASLTAPTGNLFFRLRSQ